MERKAFFFAAALSLALLASCASQGTEVEYTAARNYFVSNKFTMPTPGTDALLTITTRQGFDSIFGMATTMGDDGKPTPVDFTKDFVIAKILPVTDTETEIAPKSLTKTPDGKLLLKSSVRRGAKTSYSTQPFYAIIVSRDYYGLPITEAKE